jgi:hypothetical protein
MRSIATSGGRGQRYCDIDNIYCASYFPSPRVLIAFLLEQMRSATLATERLSCYFHKHSLVFLRQQSWCAPKRMCELHPPRVRACVTDFSAQFRRCARVMDA